MRRFSLLVLLVLLAATPAATARAVPRMPIGFVDDPSFRWSPAASANLAAAEAAHASVVRAIVDWAMVAPTRPTHPLDGNDPAYRLSDLDALVVAAQRYDLRVLLTINGTPSWANGGNSPNHPPTNLDDLTQFAQMLAARYNGSRPGAGVVTLFSVWNEPNLSLYLTPQYKGDKIVSAAEYVKLFLAAYRGIKAGDPDAVVAAGETSNRGRDEPTGDPGTDSVAPATFAELVAKADPKLPFVAWATHPVPSNFAAGPTQQVTLPNVGFSTLTRFAKSLAKWFHRPVPIWVTEYGEETAPQYAYGVSYAREAADVRKALTLAEQSPYVQMFIWLILRDSTAQTWFSGLEQSSGKKKPAYAAFASTASGIVGQSQVLTPGHPFDVTLAVPFIAWHDPAGSELGVSYELKAGGSIVAGGEPRVTLAHDDTVTFHVPFKPLKHRAYTITVHVEDIHGQSETHVLALIPART